MSLPDFRASRRQGAEPIAVISLDRRPISEDDDTERWRVDGIRIVRDIQPGWEFTAHDIDDLLSRFEIDNEIGTRFVVMGRWVWSRDYWTGEHDAWIEDVSLVPISKAGAR